MRRLVVSALLVTTLAACGQSEQAKENKRVDHQHELARSLNNRVPSLSWTEAQLNAYAADLDALERVDHGLNASQIQVRRQQLAAVRALKAENASLESARDLVTKYGAAVEAFEKTYLNNPESTKADLPGARRELDHVLELNAQVLALPRWTADEKAKWSEARKELESTRDALATPTTPKN